MNKIQTGYVHGFQKCIVRREVALIFNSDCPISNFKFDLRNVMNECSLPFGQMMVMESIRAVLSPVSNRTMVVLDLRTTRIRIDSLPDKVFYRVDKSLFEILLH